jgi:hypothetical protein
LRALRPQGAFIGTGLSWRPACALLCLFALAWTLSSALFVGEALALDQTAASHAYLEADYRLVRSGTSMLPRIERAVHGVLGQVSRECPGAGTGSPQNAQSTQMSNEVIGAMVLAVVALDKPAGRRFLAETRGLKWPDRALTRTVRAYSSNLAALLATPAPNLCSDVRAWGAGGFTALPATTLQFAPRFMTNWVSLGDLPGALSRYAAPSDRALIARTQHLESMITDLEAREVETWGEIMNTLELWP